MLARKNKIAAAIATLRMVHLLSGGTPVMVSRPREVYPNPQKGYKMGQSPLGPVMWLGRLGGYTAFNRLVTPYLDLHFDSRSEPVDDQHEPIEGEPPEIRVPNPREVGRGNPGAALCAAYAQPFPVQCPDDLGGKDRLELLDICVLAPEVAEDIPTAANYVQLLAFHCILAFHCNISF